jgi:hypothetical protein
MLNIHDPSLSIVPDIEQPKERISLVIGYIAHENIDKPHITLKECEGGGVELYRAGQLFALGELTVEGMRGKVEITQMIRR